QAPPRSILAPWWPRRLPFPLCSERGALSLSLQTHPVRSPHSSPLDSFLLLSRRPSPPTFIRFLQDTQFPPPPASLVLAVGPPAPALNSALVLPALISTPFLFPAAEAVLLPRNDTGLDLVASGAPCARGSQPWQVSLFNGLSFHCAGVLVDKSWVLTAAHCGNSNPLWARIGDDHLLLLQGEQLRRTTRHVIHPKYHQGSGPILPRRTDEHDLMLLKLARPAVLGPRIQTLRLPYRCAQPGDECQVAGWGTTATRRVKYNKGLSCSKVTVLSPKECEVFYPGVITNNMMCAGLDQGQDPCQSDSGGPLVCDETLQGILSWGVYPCGSAQHPAVYTQICKYSSWIEKTMRSN
uniref:Kallikrein related peptidase 10 n=1 Tax=Ursus maritimus TaxID=29073 RepID=A0A452TZT4_URSMA